MQSAGSWWSEQSRASSKCVDTGELPVERVPAQDKDRKGMHRPAHRHRGHLCPPSMRPGVWVREGSPCLRTTHLDASCNPNTSWIWPRDPSRSGGTAVGSGIAPHPKEHWLAVRRALIQFIAASPSLASFRGAWAARGVPREGC